MGVPGEHRGILCDHHVFRILKHWLNADSDPYYNPLNDYVILPMTFEMESHREKGITVTSVMEGWEIISSDENDTDRKPCTSSISLSDQSSKAQAHAKLMVHPQNKGKQQVQLSAISVSVDA